MTAPTLTPDRIAISPGQLAVSLELRTLSALDFCTDVDGDGAGNLFIVRRWPTLSSGEQLLWRVLAWLNGQGECPSEADLNAGLDAVNAGVALAAIDADRGALIGGRVVTLGPVTS